MSMSGGVRLVVLVTLLFSPVAALAQTILAGATPGTASVSDLGAATYEIKIALPPGVGDMTPEISLRYSSQAGNGILGVGWTLDGVPAIRRCPKTFATDGAIRVVKLTWNDAICLGNERLINASAADLQDGNSLGDGTEFRTERETFSRVIAHGSQGNGPQYFTLEAKTGRTLEFGHDPNSRLQYAPNSSTPATAISWNLSRVSDRAGNYFTYDYFNDGNSTPGVRVKTISYTGNTNANTSPFATVEFVYETRPDPVYFFERGISYPESNRLSFIRTWLGTTLVKEYRLTYEPWIAPNRSRLISIQECTGTDANSACLPPTQITWAQKGAVSWAMTTTDLHTLPGLTDITWSDDDIWMIGEVLGNGHAQLVEIDKHNVQGTNHAIIRVFERAGAQYGQLSSLDVGPWNSNDAWFLADVNGDGRVDVIQSRKDNGSTQTTSYLATSSGAFQSGVLWTGGRPGWMTDLNGDGLADVVDLGPYSLVISADYGNGDGTFTALDPNSITLPLPPDLNERLDSLTGGGGDPFPLEINGDGRADAGQVWVFTDQTTLQSTVQFSASIWGEGHSATTNILGNLGTEIVYPVFADLNGDGKSDLLRIRQVSGPNSELVTGLGMGDGTFQSLVHQGVLDGFGLKQQWIPADVNLDGRDDIVRVSRSAGPGSPAEFDLLLSNGDGSFSYVPGVGIPGAPMTGLDKRWLSADTSGDGFPDVILVHAPDTVPIIYDFELVGGSRDEVTSIQDGLGAVVSWEYGVLSNPPGSLPIYAKGTAATYPEIDIQPALPVVSTALSSDGLGGLRQVTYNYSGLRTHAQGRDLLGFGSIVAYDAQTHLTKTSTFRTDYPIQMFPDSVMITEPNGMALSTVTNTWDTSTNPPRLSRTDEVKRDVATNAILNSITTTQTVDQYNNPLTVTKTTTDPQGNAYIQTIQKTYAAYDVTHWKLGIVTSESTTVQGPGSPPLTRSKNYQLDPTTGFVMGETIDPNEAFAVQRDYLRNQFGLIYQTTSSAWGVDPRVDSVEWSPDGRFATSTTNAMGHVTQRTYDLRFGFVKTETNPNLVVSTRIDDDLGRLTVSMPGDGSDSTVSYHLGGSACGVSSAMWIEEINAASITNRKYLDVLGREVCTTTNAFDGRFAQVATTYDAAGRTASTTRPYFEGEQAYATQMLYDSIGRPFKRIDPSDDPNDPNRPSVTIDYIGRDVKTTDQLGHIKTESYDAIGRLTKVTDHFGNQTNYQYDSAGNLTMVSDPIATTTNEYDLRGRRIETVDPDRGDHLFFYDSFDEQFLEINARDKATYQQFDKLGRVLVRGNETDTWVLTYDKFDSTQHGVGSLASVVRSGGGYSQSLDYDLLGRPIRETVDLSGDSMLTVSQFVTQVSYDAVGRLSTTTYPTGLVTANVYNPAGYLSEVRNTNSTGALFWKAEGAQADGSITQERLGNGIVTVRSFDQATGRLKVLTAGPQGGVTVQNDTYNWDFVGNLTYRMTTVSGYSRTESFAYDPLDRLKLITSGSTSVRHFYGPSGTFMGKTDAGNYLLGTGTPAHAPATIAGRAYAYDLDGNQTTGWLADGTQRTITWDANNKPMVATAGSISSTFTHGPDGALLKQLSSNPTATTYQVFLGHFDLYQSRPNAQTPWKIEYRSYIRVGDRLVAIQTEQKDNPAGPIVATLLRYAHTDHLGSPVAMSDSFGNVIDRTDYNGWGKRVDAGAPIDELATISPAYTGHKQLPDLQLIHMGGRIYDPVAGLFLSPDPFVQSPASTQGWNPYSYCSNNPLSRTDPTGYHSLPIKTDVVLAFMFGPEVALLMQVDFIRRIAVPVLRVLGVALLFTPLAAVGADLELAAGALQVALAGGSIGDIFGALVLAQLTFSAGQALGYGLGVLGGLGSAASSAGAGGRSAVPAAGFADDTRGTASGVSVSMPDITAERLGATAVDNALGRSLTENEIREARKIYGDRIDYSKPRVFSTKYFPLQGATVAMAPNGNIYYPLATDCADLTQCHIPVPDKPGYEYSVTRTFIHEMGHVMQYQNGVNVLLRGLFLQIAYGLTFTLYNPYSYPSNADPSKLNIEAQAKYYEDQYCAANGC